MPSLTGSNGSKTSDALSPLECPPAFAEVMVDADNKLFDKIAWYSNLMRMGPTTPASSFPARVHPEVINMDQAIVYCFDHFLWNVLGPSATDDRWPPSRKNEAGETDLHSRHRRWW